MKYLSGFESTHIFGSGKDVLQLTKHTEYCREDLKLAKLTGLDLMRYSAPWHSIERVKGVYDWTWMDNALGCMYKLGIQPIMDPLHHTSFPEWLEDGFANPDFVDSYLRFVTALAERYPWVNNYTVINEPFVTTWFCGKTGTWYPYKEGDHNFVPMILNVCEAIVRVSRMLVERIPNVQLIHVDASEKHRAHDAKSEPFAEFMNEMRFLVQDMVLGHVNEEHYLYRYLLEHGATEERLAWFLENPARIDVIGLDYYSHSELEWAESGRVFPGLLPDGFVSVAKDYVNRFKLPVMLSETNIRGFVTDRLSWLKYMVEECERLEEWLKPQGVHFRGFCWYPFIDSTDWCSLLTQANCNVDPQGIFWLDCHTKRRNASELSDVFQALVRGQITSKDIPAYRFQEPVDIMLQNFIPMMEHWEWKEPVKVPVVVRKPSTVTPRANAAVNVLPG
jgi:beta-glucosidase/6-phospho-beta-glucosidase/beta-galactosidase